MTNIKVGEGEVKSNVEVPEFTLENNITRNPQLLAIGKGHNVLGKMICIVL